MKKGNKKEASFWMQNKKDAEEQLKEATRSKAMKTYRMKKAGKASDEQLHQANLKSDISRLRRGGASSTTLKNAAAAARRGFNYEQNPYDDDDDSGTIHPASYDPKHEIDAEYQFQLRSRRSRKAARAAGKAVPSLKEGSYVHSKGQLKKAIKGSKRNIVKAMRKGDKKEASFWMQNKKDAEEQLKEATRSKAMKTYRMKKAGKASDEQLHQANLKSDISRLRRGGASSTTLKNAAAAARRGFNYEQNPYDDDDDSGTIHPASYDPKHEIDAEYQFQLRSRRSRKAARAAGKAVPSLKEGSYVHSKGQLKKAIKGSKRNIVKAMKKGDKKDASFWMQNKKDAEEQLKEASASVPAWRKEDWVFDLPNSTVRELKAKHGKHLAQINAGSAAPKGLRKSIHTILQKHQIPNLMANPRHSIDAVMSSFHTYHSDPQISANDIYTSRRAARAAGKALKEGSLGQKRVKRVFKSKRDDMKFQDSTIAKTRNLVTRKVLRAGADPRDVATRMKDSSANLRTLNALQRFNDEARLKSKYPALRKK